MANAESDIEPEIRSLCGVQSTDPINVQPLLQTLFDNAVKNGVSQKGNRHNDVVKKFAAALFCLVGRSGYELLQTNLGAALPSISTVQRLVSSRKITK